MSSSRFGFILTQNQVTHFNCTNHKCRLLDSVDCIVTRLRAVRYGLRIPAGAESCSLLQIVQLGFAVHRVSYLTGTEDLARG